MLGEILEGAPELLPARFGWAADEDVGMCLALLILHADGIPDMSGDAATGKCAICAFARKPFELNYSEYRIRNEVLA